LHWPNREFLVGSNLNYIVDIWFGIATIWNWIVYFQTFLPFQSGPKLASEMKWKYRTLFVSFREKIFNWKLSTQLFFQSNLISCVSCIKLQPGRKSGLVVCKLDSQLEGRGFESHPILDGNSVKATYARIDSCTQSWFI